MTVAKPQVIIITADVNSSINAECPTMSTTPEPQTTTEPPAITSPAVTQRDSAMATSFDIIASLASVIALIVLLLMIGGIVLAIIKVHRKRQIKDARVKYISSEGGYLATEDGSRVDGGFDNQIVSFNSSILSMKFPDFNFTSVLQWQ